MILTGLAGVVALVASAAWAFAPMPAPESRDLAIDLGAPLQAAPPEVPPQRLDAAAFDVVLWTSQPDDASATVEDALAAQQLAPKLQLIGIVTEGGEQRAVLYDPVADTLHIVLAGERIGTVAVTAVTIDAVDITDGRSTRRLTLDPEDRS